MNMGLKASSYEPGNKEKCCGLFIWEISAQSTELKFKKQNQNVGTWTWIVQDYHSLVDSWNLICILLKLKYIQDKSWLVWHQCCKSKAFLSKKFRPRAVLIVHMGKFLTWLPRSQLQKNKISVTWPAHIEIFMKKRVVRWDHRNQASPVDPNKRLLCLKSDFLQCLKLCKVLFSFFQE